MNRNHLYALLHRGLALTGAVLFVTSCSRSTAHQKPPAAPTVTFASMISEEVTEWQEFTGRTEAVEAVEVRARVAGHIQEVKFQAGQLVKKGDVLFVIDPRSYEAEYDKRLAEYEQAQARLGNSEKIAARSAKLLGTSAISSETADTSESQSQQDRAALLAAKASLEAARLDLEFTEVRAPIDGRVSRALMTSGNYASGGGASLLTTLVSVSPVYVYADVDENSLLRFNALAEQRRAAGESTIPVELALADESGFPRRGYIESFDNRVNPETGTIVLRAVFPNTDGRIVPGLFARIRVPASGRHDAVLVEEGAIGTDQAQKFVLTLADGNTVEYRKVTLGPSIGGRRIIREGLKAGDRVVVNGMQRARPGSVVSPQERVAVAQEARPQTALR